jgi:hypothetical protein
MWPSLLAGAALLASQAQALYFYIDGPSQKCFFEELPKDTLVVGMPAIQTTRLDHKIERNNTNMILQATSQQRNGMSKRKPTCLIPTW